MGGGRGRLSHVKRQMQVGLAGRRETPVHERRLPSRLISNIP
jgi:hypothetical protein